MMLALCLLQTAPLLLTLIFFTPSALGSVIAPRASPLPCDYTTCPASSQYGTYDGVWMIDEGVLGCQFWIPPEVSPPGGFEAFCAFDVSTVSGFIIQFPAIDLTLNA